MRQRIVFSGEQQAHITAAYLAGKPLAELEEETGVGRSTLHRNLVEWGVWRPKKNKYQVDHAYFDVIDTEEKAYWLGFFAADGTLECRPGRFNLRFGLKESDRSTVEAFALALGFNGPTFVDTRRRKGKEFRSVRVKISSKPLVTALVALGFGERKTYSMRWPTGVPESLVHHFVRGYFDGDGYFRRSSGFEFVGNPLFMADLRNRLAATIAVQGRVCRASKKKRIRAKRCRFSPQDSAKIASWLYEGATVWLGRKRDKIIPQTPK
jgi:hypothetical protein